MPCTICREIVQNLLPSAYMLEIEPRADLKEHRESTLMARWFIMRLDLERDIHAVFSNPDLPVSILTNMEEQANLLDHMIPLGIQRARMWGLEEVALQSTHMLSEMLEGIQHGGA